MDTLVLPVIRKITDTEQLAPIFDYAIFLGIVTNMGAINPNPKPSARFHTNSWESLLPLLLLVMLGIITPYSPLGVPTPDVSQLTSYRISKN